jgi:hypothetical protein
VTDPLYNGLITIDMTTGAGTPAGVAGWGLDTTAAVTNITTNTAGLMYGWWDPSQDDLVSINKATGVATRVGESGVGTAVNGLSFNAADALFMVNGGGPIYSVDPATGAATFTGDLGTTAHHGDFHPVSDLYYGIDTNFGSDRLLIVANLATAMVINTLPTIDNLHTLTFVPDQQQAVIPEPGTLALLGSGALVFAGRLVRQRRRRSS